MRARSVVMLVVGLCAVEGALAPPAAAYELPTTAPISEFFRAPADEYSAGNRGVDFATAPGSAVTASDEGVVSFTGQVGGTNYVVVDHPDGLRTTYGGVSSILAGNGDHVSAGRPIATAGSSLHFGVRRGTTYLDPLSLMKQDTKLVPLDATNIATKKAIETAVTDAALNWVTGGTGSTVKNTVKMVVTSDVGEPAPTPPPAIPWWALVLGVGLVAVALTAGVRRPRRRPTRVVRGAKVDRESRASGLGLSQPSCTDSVR